MDPSATVTAAGADTDGRLVTVVMVVVVVVVAGSGTNVPHASGPEAAVVLWPSAS